MSLAFAAGGVLDDHVTHLLHDLVLLLSAALLGVIYIFELIKVHRVHSEVRQVQLILGRCVGFFENAHGALFSLLDECVDVAVIELVTNLENPISTIVYHIDHLVFLEPRVLRRNAAFLNNEAVEFEFHGLPLDHFLLHCIRRYEPKHLDNLLLADSVSAIHCLEVNLWVPVRVIQDDYICSHQIEAESTSSSRDEENMLI